MMKSDQFTFYKNVIKRKYNIGEFAVFCNLAESMFRLSLSSLMH